MGRNKEEAMNQNIYKKKSSKENKSDLFCYCKDGRLITTWGAIEKSPTLVKFTF